MKSQELSAEGDRVKPISASQLRADVYRLLDRALETGEAVEIVRRGQILRIVPPVPPARRSKLARLEPHPDYYAGDLDELVHLDWSDEWKPSL